MGAAFSRLTKEDIEHVKDKMCVFSEQEIRELYRRFKELDAEEIGRVSVDRFLCIPEISINPLGERIIRKICGEEGALDFGSFVKALCVFSRKVSNEEKIRFFMSIISPEERIDKNDLLEIANELYAGVHPKEVVRHAVDEVFKAYDVDCKGFLEYEDIMDIDCTG